MQTFESIIELIDKINSLVAEEWIYTNIKKWKSSPKEVKFYYIPEEYLNDLDDDEVYLDEDDLEMPITVQGLGLQGWMLVGNIQYIANRITDNDINEFIDQVNHYREYDDFK